MIPFLNLLPSAQQQELYRTKTLLFVHEIMLFLFVVVSFGSGALLDARAILEQKFQEVTLTAIPGSSKIAILNRDITVLNQDLSLLTNLAGGFTPWSPVFHDLIARTPPRVYWTSLVINQEGTAMLSGKAEARDELAKFKTTLQDSPYFQTVDLPLKYLSAKENIEFTIELKFNKEKLEPLL